MHRVLQQLWSTGDRSPEILRSLRVCLAPAEGAADKPHPLVKEILAPYQQRRRAGSALAAVSDRNEGQLPALRTRSPLGASPDGNAAHAISPNYPGPVLGDDDETLSRPPRSAACRARPAGLAGLATAVESEYCDGAQPVGPRWNRAAHSAGFGTGGPRQFEARP